MQTDHDDVTPHDRATLARRDLLALADSVVVSCQAAAPDNPVSGPQMMAAMAAAALLGGGAGIRANGAEDIAAVRQRLGPRVPIIGLAKRPDGTGGRFITPAAADAQEVIAAGARLVALDGTRRPRPGGEPLASVIAAIHEQGALALADVATADDGRYALECGADVLGTTLSGYTHAGSPPDGPDLDLIGELRALGSSPVFAEGRIWTREDAAAAFARGATFVVIGTAITNPTAITRRFTDWLGRGGPAIDTHPP